MPLFHVMFDGKPEVMCHVCPTHKAIADSFACDDEKGTDGGCAHVQYCVCDCDEPEECLGHHPIRSVA
jgi:hypothetical protein